MYADKLARVIGGRTLRQALAACLTVFLLRRTKEMRRCCRYSHWRSQKGSFHGLRNHRYRFEWLGGCPATACRPPTHNIANVDTPGFTRQRTIVRQQSCAADRLRLRRAGRACATIERLYSRFLTDQVNRSQSRSSELETYHAQISQIDNLLADSTTGLSPSLQEFFNSVQQVAANPGAVARVVRR
jgi:hypothetical protein